MPVPEQIEKAKLQMIQWNAQGAAEEKDPQGKPTKAFGVQFNPQSFRVNYANQKAGGDQAQGGPSQFVGKGTTKLTLELWFDTSVLETNNQKPVDVRKQTEMILAFMAPTPVKGKKNQYIPPGVRFQWGKFLFEGVMDSMDESLEYFSSDGVPLRAMVSLSISKQEIKLRPRSDEAGNQPLEEAKQGDSVQKAVDKGGTGKDWKDVAAANGIENPRDLTPGTLLDLGGGAGAGAFGGASAMASLGLNASFGGASFGVDASFGASATFGAGASASVSAGASAGASVSANASAAAGLNASASADAGASAGSDIR